MVTLAFMLALLYFLYLNHPVLENVPTIKHKTAPIFYTSILFSFLGLFIYYYKQSKYKVIIRDYKKFLKYNKDGILEINSNNNERCMINNLNCHILFHYLIYTGGILLFLLFYIENYSIFRTLFSDNIVSKQN